MPNTVTEKIMLAHVAGGGGLPPRGQPVAISIDQTLTQDATGTIAYLQFETMGLVRVRTKLSVSYIDHNTLQDDYKNQDDHRYLQSVAAKYGIWFSRAGNGICHQVHLERFGEPGKTLLGSDSHTPTGGALGMLAIGAGGLDVAVAMAGGAFSLLVPKIYGVRLSGELRGAVSAKDLILELLRRETVKGGVGAVYEYFGPGVATLSVPQRATIANMGAELGASSSVFPSDERTKAFLESRGRGGLWLELKADEGAVYDRIIDIDLSALTPLAACPHSPDNVKAVSELAGLPVDQVAIGSCTNSSLDDLAAVAEIVRGKTVHPRVSAGIACGSRTTLLAASKAGILSELIRAGFRILESACGPCIGMGFAPKSGAVSLRTFNRNFKGRSGAADAGVYLVSPETAAAAAIAGVIHDTATLELERPYTLPFVESSVQFADDMLIPPLPLDRARHVAIERGPNIKPCPVPQPVSDSASLAVLFKGADNITTDDIMPAGAKVLPFRSNIPEIAKFVFAPLCPGFSQKAQEAGGGVIVGGSNYGQGSSREHAALAPMYLGVKAVLAKSFARIHQANLINYGILPLTFTHPEDYQALQQDEMIEFSGIHQLLDGLTGSGIFEITNKTNGKKIKLKLEADGRDRKILRAGGMIPWLRREEGV
ncbi:MAG: aconitate hydratase [Spirochaetaceae bacterium]|jgi:aconitate hydratase|nr:aconitate hydratase [Spirochaetaceae bacterium]